VKRRLREAVRLELAALPPGWDIVFNPRRTVAEVEFCRLRAEVVRLFERLGVRP
jgi:ribonuclease P protein component